MPRALGLPKPETNLIHKSQLLDTLSAIDKDEDSRSRVLAMETEFRRRIGQHLASLPTNDTKFQKFNTNPFVLMFHSMKQGYTRVSEIEKDIPQAKIFMSMETSAGRMAEAVTLPVYGWEPVESVMHSSESVLDGRCLDGDTLRLATLKSGPRCLNDEMSKDIADDIINNCSGWATASGVQTIDFTYGVLYGTKKLSNKKDWHVLRNIREKIDATDAGKLTVDPADRWNCEFVLDGVTVRVTVRIGVELWNYIAKDEKAFVELCTALIRACVSPVDGDASEHEYEISDLKDIISTEQIPEDYNVGMLQKSQLEWLFFFANHFCDELVW